MAREICGGNGIILDNRVIKHQADMETIHTYEGTYEINMLVSGRELTGGLSAFKWMTKFLAWMMILNLYI